MIRACLFPRYFSGPETLRKPDLCLLVAGTHRMSKAPEEKTYPRLKGRERSGAVGSPDIPSQDPALIPSVRDGAANAEGLFSLRAFEDQRRLFIVIWINRGRSRAAFISVVVTRCFKTKHSSTSWVFLPENSGSWQSLVRGRLS